MKVDGRKNLSEPVYEHLLEMLLTQELRPGDKVPESVLAEQFGVSRTPVREAIRRLASDGILTIYPNRHAEVTQFTQDDIYQIGQARIAIDSMLAKLAVHYGSNADFEWLQQLADTATENTKSGDIIRRVLTDCDFHHAFAKISHNQVLMRYYDSLAVRIKLLVAWNYVDFDYDCDASMDHHRLVQALFTRDAEAAVNIAANHLVDFYSLHNVFPDAFFAPPSEEVSARIRLSKKSK